jgi:Raf kinase inhibitor-like YbhB/YbcL family protein
MRVRSLAIGLTLAVAACSGGSAPRPEHTATEAPGEGGMELTSPAFEYGESIPELYGCDGTDISPPLEIAGLPAGTAVLALIVDDPDAPAGTWDHWIAFDIEPTESIPESVGELGTAGSNSWSRTGYGGPCPPSGTHRYFFTVYALDAKLGLATGAAKTDVLGAIEGHVLAEATLMGRYRR